MGGSGRKKSSRRMAERNFARNSSSSSKPSMFFSVGGSSSNKEAAAAYLSFFVNDPEAGKVLGVERGIPCVSAVRDVVAPLLNAKDQIALNFVANLGDLLEGKVQLDVSRTRFDVAYAIVSAIRAFVGAKLQTTDGRQEVVKWMGTTKALGTIPQICDHLHERGHPDAVVSLIQELRRENLLSAMMYWVVKYDSVLQAGAAAAS